MDSTRTYAKRSLALTQVDGLSGAHEFDDGETQRQFCLDMKTSCAKMSFPSRLRSDVAAANTVQLPREQSSR